MDLTLKSMKKLTILALFLAFWATFSCCKKDEVCVCDEGYQECIEGECVRQENHFKIGKTIIVGSDLYYGIVEGHPCLDTVLFNIEPHPSFPYRIWVTPTASNYAQNPGIITTLKISETEYMLGAASAFCYPEGWYANIRCELFVPDSVRLTFYFWELAAVGEHVDTLGMTLVK